ncbi:cysteine synthase A [bacterium]|nr:cysteine synthase A [bacterium]
MPVYNNVLEAMGKTPLIRLNHMTTLADAEILVKFEALNVGCSIKTRTACAMIEAAEKEGLLNPDSIIVEPTSGNQGIGLALVGAVKGYHVVIIMPDSVSAERRMLVEQYGAEVILVEDKGNIGEAIDRCTKMAEELSKGNPKVYIPQQFENPHNPEVQRLVTAQEILNDVDGPIDGYCSGVGTGGTLSGIGEVLKEKNPDILIWAVEPQNAAILAGGSIKTHLQMGIGDGLIPKNLNTKIYSSSCIVSDEDALYTARQLALKEGLLCGISSGSNVYAALKMARELGPGKRVVTILPDTGERYFSTPLFRHHLS